MAVDRDRDGLVEDVRPVAVVLPVAFGQTADAVVPAPFLPAGARFSDLIAVNDVLYAATSHGCGGAADGIWAIDISSDQKTVVSWKTNGGPPLGSVAFATNGTAIVAIGPGTVSAGASTRTTAQPSGPELE